MVHIHEVSAGFMFLSALIGTALMVAAVASYRRSRSGNLAFVAGAFLVFTLKSVVVGYAIYTRSVPHEHLELVDAIGDLATVLLFLVPFLWPTGTRGRPSNGPTAPKP